MAGRPLVVGVTPGQSEVVALTAATWAQATKGRLVFAYVDPDRVVDRENPDGSVQHSALSPDFDDAGWQRREAALRAQVTAALAGRDPGWEFRYLAGRVDRALTHLARAVDAAAIVVGARRAVPGERLRELVSASLGGHLSRHQHRPVLVVPVQVVDWKHQLR